MYDGRSKTHKNQILSLHCSPDKFCRSEIRRSVDVSRGIVIVLQRALEWVCGPIPRYAARLLVSGTATPEAHKPVAVVFVLLAAPDPPSHHEQSCEHDESANTDHDTDDRGLCLRGHA